MPLPSLLGCHMTSRNKRSIPLFPYPYYVLRAALYRDSYGTIAAFWQKIANEFEKTTGKKHKTLGRAVNDLVKARHKALVEEESGENDFESSYAMAIDGWISILDNHKAVLDARKEAQGLKDQETEESDNWQNN